MIQSKEVTGSQAGKKDKVWKEAILNIGSTSIPDIIAFIPARGGSERLPGKNMCKLGNRPLIWHSIAFARKIGLSDNCYVSSDSRAILRYARKQKVHTILRPEEISQSHSTISQAVIHLMEKLREKGNLAEFILLLQPTNPLRSSGIFNELFSLISHDPDTDCVFTVTRSHEKTGTIENRCFKPDNYSFETQFHHKSAKYAENGTLYLFRTQSLLTSGSLFGKRAVPYVIDDLYRFNDINDENDLGMVKAIYHQYPGYFDYRK